MQNQKASNGIASKWAHRLLWAVYVLIALSFLVTRPLVGFTLVFLVVWAAGKSSSGNLWEKFINNLKSWRSEKVRIGMMVFTLFVALIFSIPTSSNETQSAERSIVFDVPSVFQMTMSEVRATYGEPVNDLPYPTEEGLSYGATEWTQAFQSSGYRMAVTYDLATEMPTSIFVSKAQAGSDLATSWIKDTQEEKNNLLVIGGLESAPELTIEFYCEVDELHDLEEPMCTGVNVKE